MDFNGGGDNNYGLILNAGSQMQVNFQWAEPRNGVTTDLDIFAFDNTLGQFVGQGGVDNNLQTQQPFELMNVQNSDSSPHTYFFFIQRAQGTGTPRLKFILGRPRLTDIEYKTSSGPNIIGPTIFGHNGGPNVVSTAAIPFDNSATPEPFSSRGPVAYYFGPVSGTTPAQPIAQQVLNKPDLAATDGAQTTFFGNQDSSGVFRFAGTSAAAPHAAAVAALQKSANPFLSAGDVVLAQETTASPVSTFVHTDVGAGLVNAVGAIGAHPPLVPETTITKEPKKHVFKKSVTYAFESSIPGSQFVCQIDNSKAVFCSSPVRVKRLPYGRHKFFVAALFNNELDPTPATDRFKRKPKIGR
jgi:subtilisin family serine protease